MTPPFHLVGEASPCLQPRLQVVIASIAKQSQSNFLPGLPDTPSPKGSAPKTRGSEKKGLEQGKKLRHGFFEQK